MAGKPTSGFVAETTPRVRASGNTQCRYTPTGRGARSANGIARYSWASTVEPGFGGVIRQSAHVPPSLRTTSASTLIGTSTRGMRDMAPFQVFTIPGVNPWATAAATRRVSMGGISAPFHERPDAAQQRRRAHRGCDLHEHPRPTGLRVVLRALEMLPPRRIEH